MKIAIFVGPTLYNDPLLEDQSFEWLPPAGQGDLYRIARRKPSAIALIDGRFENLPSVWHKEILWALSKGIHVFGAASMGALRAAEMAPFGMVGVGVIYKEYATGRLQDDDEVAVVHGPRELGFRPLSEAMVDVRATLAHARNSNIVSAKTSQLLLQIAKQTFFKERSWDRLLERSFDSARQIAEMERLAKWLPRNRVEQKRRDARQLVRRLRRLKKERPSPFKPHFDFPKTALWQQFVASSRRARAGS